MALISFVKLWRRKIRKAGYLKDQNGIIKRYYREFDNWNLHIENCKSFIVNVTHESHGGKVAILGSGWLLDIPIKYLEQKFDEIWLIDINHPIQIKRKYENNRKIRFVNYDLTNGLVEKAVNANTFNDFNIFLNKSELVNLETDFDLVISINLLNQLDILLCDYLQSKFKLNITVLTAIRKRIQQNHIDFLKKYNACLITDSMELLIDDNSIVEEKNLIYCELPKATQIDSWIWLFDTNKYYHVKYNTSFRVKALSF